MEPRHLVTTTTTTRTAALPPSLDRPRQSIAMPGWKKLFPRTCVRACFSRPFDSIRAHTAQIPGRGQSGAAKDSGRRSIAGRSGQVTPARHGHAIESRCGGGKSGAAFARAIGKGWRRRACFAAPIGSSACSIQPLGTKGFATRVVAAPFLFGPERRAWWVMTMKIQRMSKNLPFLRCYGIPAIGLLLSSRASTSTSEWDPLSRSAPPELRFLRAPFELPAERSVGRSGTIDRKPLMRQPSRNSSKAGLMVSREKGRR